ncbi:hypothetical protein [Mucilaginibacter sp. UYCu711]|uniref:hypothetical protein n=1 Tax=Mucilaginibacter sp. UYCu711 TaxID=3156339 RepID=UPI003D195554
MMAFFGPIIILSYVIDIFISNQLKNSDGELQIWKALYTGQVNSDVIVQGSSRAQGMIDPTMLGDSLRTRAYNLGIVGYGFEMEWLRQQLLIKYNKRPKVIIHSLDVFMFQKGTQLFQAYQFLPYVLWNKQVKEATIKYDGYKLLDYYIPLVRYYGKGFDVWYYYRSTFGTRENYHEHGFRSMTKPWQEDNNYKVKIDNDPVMLKLFDYYLAQCKKLNIKVIFVYPPEYYSGQNKIINRSQIFAYFKSYSKKYNIPFFDYSKNRLSYQKKYFNNTEHTNTLGSRIFTRDLIDTVKKTRVLDGILE